MNRLRWLGRRMREASADNQWLLPALGGVAGVVLAMIVGTSGNGSDSTWTVSVDRARDTFFGSLALIFTAFSIVLALASVAAQNVVNRFGSRVMRIYARRSPDRWVIAVFAMTAGFILAQQFQLRRLDPQSPAPTAGMVISLVLLILTASTVVWYISSLIRWFRTDRAVFGVIKSTRDVLRRTEHHRRDSHPTTIPAQPPNAVSLLAHRSGYLAEIDAEKILHECRRIDAIAVITMPIGRLVVAGESIGWLVSTSPRSELHPERVSQVADVTNSRELIHSLEYPIVALVDIAIIALSPAVNDPNSAVEVIEEMAVLFNDLAKVQLGTYAVPDAHSVPRVVVAARSFGELITAATEQIVLYGSSDPYVRRALQRLSEALQRLDLDPSDRRHVDDFTTSLERDST